jgi:hypothetical protein
MEYITTPTQTKTSTFLVASYLGMGRKTEIKLQTKFTLINLVIISLIA